ncbi:MAG TPA: nucleotidyltransferase domain-containing protein [Stellaceae bacterium]|nr:nucleotidyltransferase domain-containing protein [Stellaceae bacterium]
MSRNDEQLLALLVRELSAVPGVRALALGGSRARGAATEHSDYDIGLYYDRDDSIDLAALQRAADRVDQSDPPARVTQIGGWGPCINGGGWLTVQGARVDLLYRDIEKVSDVIGDCRDGRVGRYYQPGHPHAFLSSIYMGEIAYCRPLHDPKGALAALKKLTAPYPTPLGRALIDVHRFEATFSLENARKSADRGDVSYVAGCAFRSVACLCQILFAANGAYLLNEKGAVAEADTFPRRPAEYARRVAEVFRDIGAGALGTALDRLAGLIGDTDALVR